MDTNLYYNSKVNSRRQEMLTLRLLFVVNQGGSAAMEKKYLTIKEFASLRNVSIGSLHYYEDLGILVPAKINPQTKYRYYLPEQLNTLDTIMLCIELDIPLKELKEYVDESGCMDERKILLRGREAMKKRISEMQEKLEITQFSLDSMEGNKMYRNKTGVYKRTIEERFFIESPCHRQWESFVRNGEKPIRLFREAQERNMAPIFPVGIILHYEKRPTEYSYYFQVLHPEKEDGRIIDIPRNDYFCLQTDLSFQSDIVGMLKDNFQGYERKMVIISNISVEKLHIDSRRSEIQIPADPPIS